MIFKKSATETLPSSFAKILTDFISKSFTEMMTAEIDKIEIEMKQKVAELAAQARFEIKQEAQAMAVELIHKADVQGFTLEIKL